MQAYETAELLRQRQAAGERYLEFMRAPSMSLGIYSLPAGGVDPQPPHTEDEVYVVLDGHGQVRVEGEDRPVGPGSIVFVPARAAHHFHSITRDLNLLVFFAPAESS